MNQTSSFEKKKLNQWLDGVDYSYINSASYLPSEFSLRFMNFIKLINNGFEEMNKTPPIHLAMMDKLGSRSKHIANLCFRGSAKTTTFFENLAIYMAVFQELPGIKGNISGMIYVSDSIDNGVKTARESLQFKWENSPFVQEWLPEARFTEKYIEFTNKNGKKFGIKLYGASTGIRGSRIFGERPKLAVMDDLMSDLVASSDAALAKIKETVYKGIYHALHPSNYKLVFNGTPFNRTDIIVEAIESGGWDVNVWPVCERFPCERDEFRGAWEDRFSYDDLMVKYKFAMDNNKPDSFYQELMLRISSDDDRLVQDHDIRWYSLQKLMSQRENFNFYITTDFATSEKQSADYSVISVWAINNRGQWFWVDGFIGRVTMDVNVDKLFEFVTKYNPQSVGVEITGQQGGFISWIQNEMMTRNTFFNFARSHKGSDGIRPTANKLSRFQMVVPLFKSGNIFFPKELKDSKPMVEFKDEIELATATGLKGKDDFLDTISMLLAMNAWKPSGSAVAPTAEDSRIREEHNAVWNNEPVEQELHNLDSYIV